MSQADPSAPLSVPGTGEEAASALVELMCHSVLRTPMNPWRVVISTSALARPGEHAGAQEQLVGSQAAVAKAIAEVAPAVRKAPTIAHTSPVLENWEGPGEARFAIAAIQVSVELADLFGETGPLYRLTLACPDGQLEDRRLTAGDLSEAHAFLRRHLAQSPFRPTLALDLGWRVRLLYVLRRPIARSEEADRQLSEASRRIADCIHGALPWGAAQPLPLPLAGPTGRCSSRILWLERARLFRLDSLVERARRINPVEPPRPPTGPGTHIPLALRVRTLPDGWGLEDLDLPPDIRQVVVEGQVDGMLVLDKLNVVVKAMALRGHSWPDVELLLDDPRFSLANALRLGYGGRSALRLRFAHALRRAPRPYGMRLPHGIRRIVELKTTIPGNPVRRYIVRCGPVSKPVDVEVSYDALITQSEFRTALGRVRGSVPYRVPSEVWKGAIAAGLGDPRTFVLVAPAIRRPSLESAIHEYCSRARPWNPICREDPLEWPLARDGLTVFPLQHLRAYLADRCGTRLQLREITGAIRSLGGANHGPMRFGPHCVRTWELPGGGPRTR